MDPISPDTPPVPPPRKSSPWKIILILAAVGLLGLVLLSLAAPAIKHLIAQTRQKAGAQTRRVLEEQTRPLSPGEEDAFRAFIDKVISASAAKDYGTMSGVMDTDAFIQLATVDFDMPPAARKGFDTTLKNSPGGLLRELAGMRGRLLRVHTRNGRPAATCRFDIPEGGAKYLDFVVRRDGPGFRIIDIHNYLFASDCSSEIGRALAILLPDNTTAFAKAFGLGSKADQATGEVLIAISKAFTADHFEEVISLYEGAAAQIRDLPFVYAFYIQALQNSDNDETVQRKYAKALEDGRRILGKGAAIDLLQVDMHFLNGDFAAARKAAEAIREVVGDDGYIEFLIGMSALKQGDTAAAKEALERGQKLEPDLPSLKDLDTLIRDAGTSGPVPEDDGK